MDVNKLLNTTLAGQIAKQLDAKDGNKDEQISASIWNKFVNEIGTGKTISENGSISIVNAMNSITTYAVRLAKQAGKNVDELAKEWLENAGGTDSASKSAEGSKKAPKADKKEEVKSNNADAVKGTKNAGKKKGTFTTSSIKVTLKPKYMSKQAKDIITAANEGKALKAELKQGITKNITPDNVAYAMGDVSFGPNSQAQAKVVFEALVEKLDNLKLFRVGKDYGAWDSFKKLPYKNQNALLREYRDRIIKAQNEIVNKSQKEKDAHNSSISKIQPAIDKGNQLLVDVANGKLKAKITRGKDEEGSWASANLPDGRWIEVNYNKDGSIGRIKISYDTTTRKKNSDGGEYDPADIVYASGVNSGDNCADWPKGSSISQFNAIIKAIFGDAPKE